MTITHCLHLKDNPNINSMQTIFFINTFIFQRTKKITSVRQLIIKKLFIYSYNCSCIHMDTKLFVLLILKMYRQILGAKIRNFIEHVSSCSFKTFSITLKSSMHSYFINDKAFIKFYS